MSVHEKTVNNFIHLLKTQPSLFSTNYRSELTQLIDSQPDDIKADSDAISNWCEAHPEVDDALAKLDETGKTKGPGSTKPNTNIPKYQLDKKTLINTIQQSSSAASDPENKGGNN